ncbi:DgyrCDS739 [Dimorphilus gyrociliatus]|uniref:Profilin n=1 Tax=Dimorphilus gyrociliatus TaxID=2664684 RepID=A0A7I8V5J9_9ANNE|nr:DgyrCDS739 [Dimorphilus gyrociliatus]
MSWNSYIDNLIAHSKDASGKCHVESACIISIDGGTQWTTAGANVTPITPNEAAEIAKPFKSCDFTSFMVGGCTISSTRYQFLREMDKKICLFKLKDHGSISMQSSKTAIVIAKCPEGGQQGNANKAVAVIAEYLESLNM